MPVRIIEDVKSGGEVCLSEELKKGEAFLSQGNLDEAEKCFRSMLQRDPRHPSAYGGLGLVTYYRKDYKEAEKFLRLAVQYDPEYAAAWNNLGGVFIARQKYSEAKEALDRALSLKPDLEDALNQRFWLEEKVYNPTGDYRHGRYPTVSLCMIAKNEERNLPRALALVQNVVDEMIVVDTGSTDRTVEIARSFGAQVYSFPWCDDFSAARNESLRYATGEWILTMDADDEMREEDLKKLKLLLRVTDYTAFEVLIRSPLTPTGRREEMNYLIRVFRNHPAIRFRNRIHETVTQSVVDLGGKVGRLKTLVVLHHGYESDLRVSRKVHERNLQILLREYEENPEDLRVMYYLASAYLPQGKREEAKSLFLRLLERSRELHVGALVLSCIQLAQMSYGEGGYEEAVKYLEEALEKDPFLPDTYYWLGRVFHKMGRYEESLAYLEKTFQVDYGKTLSPFVFIFFDEVDAYCRMADCAYRLGKEDLAQEYWAKLTELTHNDPDGLHSLGKTMLDTGCLEEAEMCFRSALTLHPLHREARNHLLNLLLRQGRLEESKNFLQELRESL